MPRRKKLHVVPDFTRVWRLPDILERAGIKTSLGLQRHLRRHRVLWSAKRCWQVKTGALARVRISDLVILCTVFDANIADLIDVQAFRESSQAKLESIHEIEKPRSRRVQRTVSNADRYTPVVFRMTPDTSHKSVVTE